MKWNCIAASGIKIQPEGSWYIQSIINFCRSSSSTHECILTSPPVFDSLWLVKQHYIFAILFILLCFALFSSIISNTALAWCYLEPVDCLLLIWLKYLAYRNVSHFVGFICRSWQIYKMSFCNQQTGVIFSEHKIKAEFVNSVDVCLLICVLQIKCVSII